MHLGWGVESERRVGEYRVGSGDRSCGVGSGYWGRRVGSGDRSCDVGSGDWGRCVESGERSRDVGMVVEMGEESRVRWTSTYHYYTWLSVHIIIIMMDARFPS